MAPPFLALPHSTVTSFNIRRTATSYASFILSQRFVWSHKRGVHKMSLALAMPLRKKGRPLSLRIINSHRSFFTIQLHSWTAIPPAPARRVIAKKAKGRTQETWPTPPPSTRKSRMFSLCCLPCAFLSALLPHILHSPGRQWWRGSSLTLLLRQVDKGRRVGIPITLIHGVTRK